jgi:OOP family OmpA-OmpF porin
MYREIKGRTKPVLLLLVLLCCSGVANAQGWYLGGGIGDSRAGNLSTCSSLNGLFPGFSCSGDSNSTGWRVFAGYDISQNLAVEGSYVDLGKFHGTATSSPGLNPDTAAGNANPTGFVLDAVFSLPATEQFGFIARLGVFAWSLDTTVGVTRCCGAPSQPSTSASPSGTSVDFGVGVKYDFNKNLGVRAEYQKFANIGSDATGKSDVSQLSASLVYHFQFGSSFY